jgi:hypothetical protein
MHSFTTRALCVGVPLITAAVSAAQDASGTQSKLEELEKRLAELRSAQADEIDDLKFQVATLEKEVAAAKAAAQSKTAQSNNVFNPQITVFGNFVGRWDDQRVYAEDDPSLGRVDSRMNLREVEIDLRAPIDPWAEGVVIASTESPSPGEFDTSIEEGYCTLKKLPFLDAAPGGLKQIGRAHV